MSVFGVLFEEAVGLPEISMVVNKSKDYINLRLKETINWFHKKLSSALKMDALEFFRYFVALEKGEANSEVLSVVNHFLPTLFKNGVDSFYLLKPEYSENRSNLFDLDYLIRMNDVTNLKNYIYTNDYLLEHLNLYYSVIKEKGNVQIEMRENMKSANNDLFKALLE